MTATNREYNGTTVVSLSGGILSGKVSGDDLSLNLGAGTIASPDVGSDKSVSTNIQLTGADAGNYIFSQPQNIKVLIFPRQITTTGLTAIDREYDGTNIVELDGIPNGIITGEDVSVYGTVLSGSVGNNKYVSLQLTGADAGNYYISYSNLTVNITPKQLTITDVYAVDRVYNGTTTVLLKGGVLNGVAAGHEDTISFNLGKGTIEYPDIGEGLEVTTDIKLTDGWWSSGLKNNYILIQPTDITVNITEGGEYEYYYEIFEYLIIFSADVIEVVLPHLEMLPEWALDMIGDIYTLFTDYTAELLDVVMPLFVLLPESVLGFIVDIYEFVIEYAEYIMDLVIEVIVPALGDLYQFIIEEPALVMDWIIEFILTPIMPLLNDILTFIIEYQVVILDIIVDYVLPYLESLPEEAFTAILTILNYVLGLLGV